MGFPVYGVAFDRENGWMFAREQAGNYPIHVYQMDDNNRGEQIGLITNWSQFNGNQVNEYAIEWVYNHPDGQLWVGNYGNQRLYEITVDTNNWTCTGSPTNFATPGMSQPYDGVAHDGHNIWTGGYGASTIRVYDDGITEAYWLSLDPTEGQLESHADANINIHLDAAGLVTGRYIGDIHFLSNDPADPDQVFRVTANVQGSPDIQVKWATEDGFRDNVLDWNRRYDPNLFTGGPYDMQLTVTKSSLDRVELA